MTSQWRVRTIAAAVNEGRWTAQEVATEALERIAAYDAIQPEAWISRVSREALLEAARRVQTRIATGESLPLAGVPVAVKDNIDVGGLETTAACPAFAYRADASAPLIERLMAAGALVVGKTNLDQFATGLVGTRSPYGSPGCVFNTDYVSGGSSSGSAVVVGAGLVPLALGTDTAGSGRVPAAFNHLVGLKPTRGRWSSRGVVPACRTLDCVTTLTADVEDAMLTDSVLTSYDTLDPYARRPPLYSAAGLPDRIGIPSAANLTDLAPEDAQLFEAALGRVLNTGGTPIEVDIAPLLEAANLLYSGPWVAERTTVLEGLLKSQPSAIHPVVRAIVQAGLGLSAVDTFRGLYTLQTYARAAEMLWDKIDALVLPTTPTIFRRSEVLAEPMGLNAQLGRYTNFVNLLDMCAVSVPAGFRRNGTGCGISLIAPAWKDRSLLELAMRYEQAGPAWVPPPLEQSPRATRICLAVVGAHLSGMPLNWQLASRQARLVSRTRTAPVYRLYALQGQTPSKPALVHQGAAGACIEVEVYELEVGAFGSFVSEIPPPLAIGTVALEDGSSVPGFVAEPRALQDALDITTHGGWRAYLAAR